MPQIDMYRAPENSVFVEIIALLVSQKGLEFERKLMSIDRNYNEKNYRFLCKSDPFHAFYKQKLNRYRKAQNQDCCVHDDDDDDDELREMGFPSPPPSVRYRYLSFHRPKSDKISIKDLGIIKLTAQFVARYDMYFLRGLMTRVANKPQFEFLERTSDRFSFYNGLVRAYSTVLRPCSETLMMNDFAFLDVFEVFFYRLQLEKLEEGDFIAMIDLHAFVSGIDHFAYMDDDDFHCAMLERPPHLSSMMRRFSEMQPLRSKPLTTTTQAREAPQPVEIVHRFLTYTLFEKQITLKELGIIKLTAQFVARYGPRFRRDLMEKVAMNPLFEFLKPTGECSNNMSKSFFNLSEYAYSRVLLPSDQLWKSEDGCTAAVLEFFLQCLQLEKLEDGVEMATVDLHALVSGVDCFTHMKCDVYSTFVPPPERLSKFMGTQLRNPQNHQDCIAADGGDYVWPRHKSLFKFPAKGLV